MIDRGGYVGTELGLNILQCTSCKEAVRFGSTKRDRVVMNDESLSARVLLGADREVWGLITEQRTASNHLAMKTVRSLAD